MKQQLCSLLLTYNIHLPLLLVQSIKCGDFGVTMLWKDMLLNIPGQYVANPQDKC